MTPASKSSARGIALPVGYPNRLLLPDCSAPSPALCPLRHKAPSTPCAAFFPQRCLPPAGPTHVQLAVESSRCRLPPDLLLSALPPPRCSNSVPLAGDSIRIPTTGSAP